jgi:endo-1,4-beta-xylanase
MQNYLCLTFVAMALLHAEEPVLPPEAKPLLVDAPLQPTQPKPEEGRITKTEAGFLVESPGKLEKSYNLSVSRRFTQALAKDQVCLAVIQARTTQTDKADGKGRITVAIQNTKDYSATPLWKNWVVGKDWETSFFSFSATHELPADAGIAKLIIGDAKQVIEVADFQIYRLPMGYDIFKLPTMRKTYVGRELDAPWRVEAEARISKHRKGKWTIVAQDKTGKTLPGAKISVRMKRHLFGFGSSVDPMMLSGLDAKMAAADQQKYLKVTDELFSRIVPENGQRPRNSFAPLDAQKPWEEDGRRRNRAALQWTLQWAQDRKMSSRGHYLVWGYLEPWARQELDQGGIVGLLDAYQFHFDTMIPFNADYVSEWDAINHPVPFVEADALYRVISPNVYADFYRKLRPLTDKILFINEDTFNPDRALAFEKHIQQMMAAGVTPDGCGFQSHFSDYSIPSIEHQWETWSKFGQKVKHLTVTEYDLQTLDDALHADHLRDMMTLCFSHPQMTGFVIWGFWEGRHWKPTAAMFKKDWTERPAVQVWRDLVKGKWWTHADLTADAEGQVSLDAFFGWFDIVIDHDGKTKAFEVRHAVRGGKPQLRLD